MALGVLQRMRERETCSAARSRMDQGRSERGHRKRRAGVGVSGERARCSARLSVEWPHTAPGSLVRSSGRWPP
eukprot:878709-Prymnesium_polylepis.1